MQLAMGALNITQDAGLTSLLCRSSTESHSGHLLDLTAGAGTPGIPRDCWTE